MSRIDIFSQITNAILDLQGAHHQNFERPLKSLAQAVQNPDLKEINHNLTEAVNFDAFLAASERTQGSMVGSGRLVWPDSAEEILGLTIILIERMATNPNFALQLGSDYFYSGNKIISGLHALTGQVLVPFARDYKNYVMGQVGPNDRIMKISPNKVFIVHGHDDAALHSLARFLEKLGLQTIVLREQPDQGRTIIEKFEQLASDVGFAVALLTPDDVGGAKATAEQDARARQNVIFELGYFAGRLGRGCVCVLKKGRVEIPSDLFGVIYTEMDPADGWKARLVHELKAAKLEFDANRMWQ
ncbi:TIR domain-containing protein [Methylorubrum thiocyanatum]|uniref:TIR domain-containing protein n=1 Tax=Methylorubrum thiocyanatum TaxID=47958 RepID=UPI0035C822A7